MGAEMIHQENSEAACWSPTFGDELFGASGMRRRQERPQAQGQRLGAMHVQKGQSSVRWNQGLEAEIPPGSVTTKHGRTGAEATGHLARRQNSGTK